MKTIMMVAVLVLVVVPVVAQVKVVPIEDPRMSIEGSGDLMIACPSPSTYSFAVELRRIIKAQEQKLKVLRELLVELEKDWVMYDSTSGILEFQNDVIPFTFRDAPDLVIDKTITWQPKQ